MYVLFCCGARKAIFITAIGANYGWQRDGVAVGTFGFCANEQDGSDLVVLPGAIEALGFVEIFGCAGSFVCAVCRFGIAFVRYACIGFVVFEFSAVACGEECFAIVFDAFERAGFGACIGGFGGDGIEWIAVRIVDAVAVVCIADLAFACGHGAVQIEHEFTVGASGE